VRGELFEVWKDTRLIVLTAQVAAIYAAVLIPFKAGIPIIPGFVEFRPANAIPVVASLLFGPAAAWGAAIGNLIGDLFGTLGPGSLFGAIGNFCYAYLPYRLWGHLGPLSSGQPPELRSVRQGAEYLTLCILSSAACASIIGWGLDIMHLLPFQVLAPAIFLNNLMMSALLGPPLLRFLYPRVARWGLLYGDISRHPHPRSQSDLQSSEAPQSLESPAATIHGDAIIVSDLGFSYRGATRSALHDVSLSLPENSMTLILGGTGSGKSTLCYCLNGLIPHHLHGKFTGTILIGGRDSRHWTVWQQAKTVGLLFQDFEAQLVSTNVEQELAFPLRNLCPDLPPNERNARIAESLAQVGLEGYQRRDPLSLSGGERQRLAIASILVARPPVLALDDPTTDLDPVGRATLYALLRRLLEKGTTVVVTDRESDGATPVDHLCLLAGGGIAWNGPAGELLIQPDLMEQYGVRPNALAAFFAELGYRKDLPLTPGDAAKLLAHKRVTILDPPTAQTVTRKRAPVIEICGAEFAYSSDTSAERRVLDRIDLAIEAGEFVALVGQNGSGKTTLAKLFNGLLSATRGLVRVHGQDTRSMKASRLAAHVGYVFQNPDHQIFAETVFEEVAFGPRNLNVTVAEIPERVHEALTAVGLGHLDIATADPFSLTKGDRQRVAVASVLATRPEILIFDEPTTGLDYREIRGMMALIQRLNQAGHTIIMITHCMWVVAEYAARCVVMQDGRIVADGTTREIFSHPERLQPLGLRLPLIPEFSRRYGVTLLTPVELHSRFRIG
jgi:energy-coupling factor transport system ATP-binding protein